MAQPSHDRGPPPPATAPLPRLSWRTRFRIWAVLQLGGAATLLAAALLVAAIAPLFGRVGSGFLRQWSTAFLVLPATFIPALILWHRWALARFGKRGGFFRLVAEVAFAVEVIGCVLFQNIA